MAEERKQSPHYIPELDPQNRKRSFGFLEHTFLWIEYLGYAAFFVALLTAVVAWIADWQTVLIGASVIGCFIGFGLVFSRVA